MGRHRKSDLPPNIYKRCSVFYIRMWSNGARDQAKVLKLGITYGMSPAGVALRLGITSVAAERLLAGFFAAYTIEANAGVLHASGL